MLIILLWMLGFALLHSIMADKRVKAWVGQYLGERFRHGWYRLLYNIIALLSLIPVFWYMLSRAEVLYSVPQSVALVFRGIQAVGLIGLMISLLQIDWLRFAGLRQAFAYLRGDSLPLATEQLKTDGIYAFVRHPLYLFSLLVLWFTPTLTDTGLFFNIATTLYFVAGSVIEERRMIDYYGEEYMTYQERVPWLIPFFPTKG
ncbi:MAG: methyltransferase family protein [Anaerolineae bacterium]